MDSRRRKNQGFTLVEIVVALALSAVVMGMLGFLLISFQRAAADTARLSVAQTDAGTLMDSVLTHIRGASSVRIDPARGEDSEENVRYVYAKDGGVYTDDSAPVLAAHFYTYGVSFKNTGAKSIQVTITVYQNGETVFQQDSNLVFDNLAAGAVSGVESGNCLAYQVPDSLFIGVRSITVQSAASFITEKGGTMAMTALVSPDNASSPAVYWTVDDTGVAVIGSDGVLKALANGVVTVTAAAVDGTEVRGSKIITVSGQ